MENELSHESLMEIRETAKYLTQHTYIPYDRTNPTLKRHFETASNSAYRDEFVRRFSDLGYDFGVTDTPGKMVAYIRCDDSDSPRCMKLTKAQTIYLLLLIQKCKESYSTNVTSLNTSVEAHDVLSMYQAYTCKKPDIRILKEAVCKFDDFNLVDMGKRADFNESTLIRLYPSLSLVLPNSDVQDVIRSLSDLKNEGKSHIEENSVIEIRCDIA